MSQQELQYIQSDEPVHWIPLSLGRLLPYRQTWAFAIAKFLTDPIWWFYLFWLPKYLNQTRGLSLLQIGPPLVAIYLAADIGSILGGWMSSSLIKRGWTANLARKLTMLICAVSVIPIVFAPHLLNLWAAVAVIGLATAAHQGWSANLFATVADMFPQSAVGSIVGIGGTAGAIGGMLIAASAGLILQFTGSYTPLFAIAGSAYILALVVLQILAPDLRPALQNTTA